VGRAKHLQLPCAAPLLSQQLFSGIKTEAPEPLLGWFPTVAAGPDLLQMERRALVPADQQSAVFLGVVGSQGAFENDEAMPIKQHCLWRWCTHPDTL